MARARWIICRLTLSPVLWRKLRARARRPRAIVALRLVCDRELEIEKLRAREYWSLVATLTTPRGGRLRGPPVGADEQEDQRLDIGTGAEAEDFKQRSRHPISKSHCRRPNRRGAIRAPSRTSTLQQEASRKLGFAPAAHHRVAQRLYEGVDIGGETTGLITYMRTTACRSTRRLHPGTQVIARITETPIPDRAQ